LEKAGRIASVEGPLSDLVGQYVVIEVVETHRQEV
jgi:hypothetical protein